MCKAGADSLTKGKLECKIGLYVTEYESGKELSFQLQMVRQIFLVLSVFSTAGIASMIRSKTIML